MIHRLSNRELIKQMDFFQSELRKNGFKITPQRDEIYKMLLESSSHPSANSIFEKVRKKFPSISLDTVYRNVESLEKLNLVNRITGSEGKNHFEANITPHHHFICNRCQTIYDFTYEKANTEKIHLPIEALKIGNVESTHLLVKGICKKCKLSK